MQHVTLAWTPGPLEMAVILVVALLLFGRRLPDVARSIGKSIVEFKRGIKDIEHDIDNQAKLESKPAPTIEAKSSKTSDLKDSTSPQ